jgi:hypothetical protein
MAFAVRAVALSEWQSLLARAMQLLQAAGWRLFWLFVACLIPLEALTFIPYAGFWMKTALASIAFCSLYFALDAVAKGGKVRAVHLLRAFRQAPDKLALLAIAGMIPLAFALLGLVGRLGFDATWHWMGDIVNAEVRPSEADWLVFKAAAYAASAFFLFVLPICALRPWSASRSLAANFIALRANWQWALTLAVVGVALEMVGMALVQLGGFGAVLSIALSFAAALVLLGFGYALFLRVMGDAD